MDTLKDVQMKNRELVAVALESGEFKQGTNALRTNDDGFCCLGVACEVYRRETGKGEWKKIGGSHVFEVDNTLDGLVLPFPVKKWLGFATPEGTLTKPLRTKSGDNAICLTFANDHGVPFKEIAKLFRDPDAIE